MPSDREIHTMTDSPLCVGDPLAKALAELEPMPTTMNRDRLLFAAGAAGRDREVIYWKRIARGQTIAACLFVGIGIALSGNAPSFRGGEGWSDPTSRDTGAVPAPVVRRTVSPPKAAVPTYASTLADDADATAAVASYLQLRANVLAIGVNALPNPIAPPADMDAGQLENSLQLPRGTFAIHGAFGKKSNPERHE